MLQISTIAKRTVFFEAHNVPELNPNIRWHVGVLQNFNSSPS